MKNENLMQLAEQLIKYGKQNGADQMQISVGSGSEFSVEVRDGNIEKLTEAGSKSLSLKVIVDDKVAWSSSSDFNENSLKKLIDNAISRARYTNADKFAALPDMAESFIDPAKLELFDQRILEISPEEKIKTAKEVEKIALKDKRIRKSSGSWYGTDQGEYILVNSKGFAGSYKVTSCSFGVGLQAGEGDNFFEDGWGTSGVNLDKLKPVDEIAKIAVNRVTRLIGGKKIPSQNVPVVFEPGMTASILGFLYSCISGGAVYMKQSFLAGKIHEKIASDVVTIIDDPHIPKAPGSRPFDGEGVPTQKKTVLDKGVLNTYLMDTYSARKLNMKSTGNASGPGNMYLVNGKYSQDEIIKSIDKGLLLTKTIGQGTVATTGDISKGAFGLWIEKGEIIHPVAEITISGNLGNILKNIDMVGNDNPFDSSISAPTIRVSEMTLSGK